MDGVDDREALLRRIRAAHQALAAAADGLDEASLLAPAPGMAGWTRKDVLAHVEWWSDHSARIVAALVAGEAPYPRGGPWSLDGQNARILAENRDRPAGDVRAGEADAYARLVTAVESATDEQLFTVGRFQWLESDEPLAATIEGDSSAHYAEHLPQLRASPAEAIGEPR
jgi:deoxyribodipyrimidine photolyase-like uncharacterized protein